MNTLQSFVGSCNWLILAAKQKQFVTIEQLGRLLLNLSLQVVRNDLPAVRSHSFYFPLQNYSSFAPKKALEGVHEPL